MGVKRILAQASLQDSLKKEKTQILRRWKKIETVIREKSLYKWVKRILNF